ncbi:hypothetical protein GLOTRDRAFT_39098, partial [Gloeophyllum trabeum ATCC 11539]
FILAIVCITVVYRLSPWHPLASFPGPLSHRITDLKLAYMVYTGKRHQRIAELHREYGRIVRTGPSTLSINSHSAVKSIYAVSHCMDKSKAYRPGRLDAGGLFFLTDVKRHNERKRIWSGAFTSAA